MNTPKLNWPYRSIRIAEKELAAWLNNHPMLHIITVHSTSYKSEHVFVLYQEMPNEVVHGDTTV